ncbi:MAG: class I SAM-dependent methyltransferase [Candidatus Sumerlaeota bacterium]|nr:class I SAM-dependent methyltransferase [Candidatus Sumerlaeota bacterium]
MPSGPMSDTILAALAEYEPYRELRAGKIAREEFLNRLEASPGGLEQRLGNARHIWFLASRYPADFDRQSDEIFAQLRADGIVAGQPSVAEFEAFRRRLLAIWDHGENRTFIHPDEARVLYFLSMAKKPKRMVAIGCYYGYWAIWAMPGVAAGDGRATLIDPNPAVTALAEKNFKAMGFGERTEVVTAKAETLFAGMDADIDMVLLDANGGRDNPDPNYHGKGIYAFMMEGIYDKMVDGALLVVHNDYRPNIGSNRLAQKFLDNLASKLDRFHAFVDSRFRKGRVTPTPDGLGVYLK